MNRIPSKRESGGYRHLGFECLEGRRLLTGTIQLVRSFETWNGGIIPSTDPADITYHAPSGNLYIADSEIDELPAYYQGQNVFETSLTGGTLVRSIATGNNEPTGITYNEFDGYFYITNDDNVTLKRYDSTFSQPLASVSTTAADSTGDDPEGVTSDPVTGDLYVTQGISGGKQVHVYDANLQFLRRFPVGAQIADPEGIAFNPYNEHLYLVSTPGMRIVEYTTSGTFVNDFSIAGFQPVPVTPQGVTFAPTSSTADDPSELALYIADGGIDNFPDGRIYEAVLVNQTPQVNAGVDQVILAGQQASLAGTATDDGLPDPPGALTISWQTVSGPGTVNFSNPSSVTTTASFSQPGVYSLSLSANDGALVGSDTLIVQVVSAISPSESLYFSLDVTATLPGGTVVDDEDIAIFDGTNFVQWFDGSDVGLASRRLSAFAVTSSNEFLFTLTASATLPGISGTVEASDIVRFQGTQLGNTTSGTFSLYFDGSDVDLTTSSEKIDTVELLSDGSLVISTTGSADVTGASVSDEDLLRFVPTSLGTTTSGVWEWYLDSSDVGLASEDVNALSLGVDGEIYLSVEDDFAVGGLSGSDEDVFVFRPSSIGSSTAGQYLPSLYFDGSQFGLAAFDLYAIDRVFSAGGGANEPPVAVDDFVAVIEDAPTLIQVLLANGGDADSDPDGTLVPASVAAVTLPSSGLLTNNNDGTFQYLPNNNFTGADQFTYTVRDNLGAVSNVATVTISITPVNDVPVLAGIPDVVMVEETTNNSIDLDNYFTDAETLSGNAVFEVVSTFAGISAAIDPTFHQLSITGDIGFIGAGDITIRATDTGDGSSLPLSAEDTLHVTVVPPSNGSTFYMSFASTATLGSLTVANEDIVTFDPASLLFSLFFDGSDVGLSSAVVDALTVVNMNEILLSFASAITLPGITDVVDDSDVVRFAATSWGASTSGTFSVYFDGSDVGLVEDAADIDALELLDDGRIVVSLVSNLTLGALVTRDEDLLVFAPTSLGDVTSGVWDFYVDGSDLGASSYDVNAFSQEQNGTLLLSFHETFALGGTGGENEDVVELFASQLGGNTVGVWGALRFDGSQFGLASNDLMSLDVVPNAANAVAAVALNDGHPTYDPAVSRMISSSLIAMDSIARQPFKGLPQRPRQAYVPDFSPRRPERSSAELIWSDSRQKYDRAELATTRWALPKIDVIPGHHQATATDAAIEELF